MVLYCFVFVMPFTTWTFPARWRGYRSGVTDELQWIPCLVTRVWFLSAFHFYRAVGWFHTALPLLMNFSLCARTHDYCSLLAYVGKQAGFHTWLTGLMESGNITRQEAVSMLPPLFLDVQPKHLVSCLPGLSGRLAFVSWNAYNAVVVFFSETLRGVFSSDAWHCFFTGRWLIICRRYSVW